MKDHQEKSEFELIKDLFINCLKHWYYFVICFVVCLGIGMLYLKLKTPTYAIESKVLLRGDDASGLSEMPLMKSLGFSMGKSGGTSAIDEANMMSSYGTIKKMIAKLGINNTYTLSEYWGIMTKDLYDQSPIEVQYPNSMPDSLPGVLKFSITAKGEDISIEMILNKDKLGTFKLASLPGTIQTPRGEFTFTKTPFFNNYGKSFDLSILIFNYNLQAQIYEKMIEIESTKKSSNLLNLKVLDANITRGKRILKVLIDTHNEESAEEKNLVGNQMITFIETRLQEVGDKLNLADEKIQEFKEKYKLTDIESDATAYMEQGTELMPLLIDAKIQMEMTKMLDVFISDPKNAYSPIPLSSAISNEAIASVIGKYNEELVKRNELLQSTKKQSPISQSISSQLNSQRENLLTTLDNSKKGLQISVNKLNEKQNELETRFNNFPVMEKQYLSMRREQEVQQAVYLFLQQKKEETAVTSVSVMPKLRFIDEPHSLVIPDSPSYLKTMVIVFFMGGIFIPIVLIYSIPFAKNFFRKKKNAA